MQLVFVDEECVYFVEVFLDYVQCVVFDEYFVGFGDYEFLDCVVQYCQVFVEEDLFFDEWLQQVVDVDDVGVVCWLDDVFVYCFSLEFVFFSFFQM